MRLTKDTYVHVYYMDYYIFNYFVDDSHLDSSESDDEIVPTPNGHKYYVPDVPVEEKPNEGDVFDNFDEAYNMYLEYAQKARFSIRQTQENSSER